MLNLGVQMILFGLEVGDGNEEIAVGWGMMKWVAIGCVWGAFIHQIEIIFDMVR